MPIIQTVIQGGGTTPTGTKSITANGVYDVTNFASADVQVPTTAPAHYVEKTVDANGMLKNTGSSLINFNGVTSIDSGVLAYQYQNVAFPANTIVNLSGITKFDKLNSCVYTFNNSSGITSVDLSGLTTISVRNSCDYMFQNSSITSVDLSGLTTVSANNVYCFAGTLLTSVNLNSLTTVTANCGAWFHNCVNLVSVKMNALNTISGQIGVNYQQFFGDCTHLESVEFGGLTASTFTSVKNQFQYLFRATTGSQATNGCTVHFPSNFDPSDPDHTFDASTLTGYPTFGGNANYIHVAFDLPATE